jgi:hypothetical protein
MRTVHRSLAALAVAVLLAPAGLAQDSVALTACLGGDATSPWDDASGPNGSEQCNDFVVDLNSFTTCWGTEFGIAPLLKSSRTSAGFTGSLVSAQGISQTQTAIAGSATAYGAWTAPGFGVNNDPTVNTAPATVSAPCDMQQFGVAFAEFATTDLGSSYNGIIGARVAFQPSNPGRLYVSKTMAATNSENPVSNYAAVAMGSVNADGEVFIRGDGFGATGGALTILPGNNIYSIDTAGRDCNALNVISDDTPGLKDTLALSHYVVNDLVTAHGPPSNVGLAAVPTYVGGNFNAQEVSGPVTSVTASTSHLASLNDARGNVSYSPNNFGPLGSTHGLASILAYDGGSALSAQTLNVWGLDSVGSPTGALDCVLPGSITDNDDGFTTLGPAGTLEFDHYHSQIAFQGGNGQVATRVLENGDLIIAAVVDHPVDGGANYPINAIAVCKVDGVSGAETWTLAGWNDGVSGKVIKDGPGGAQKGTLVPLNLVTGGTPLGPSMSSPMIDSKGNIYFLSSLFTDDDSDFATGLVRAVFDEGSFSYELDLVMKTGHIFRGENSTKDYLVTFIGIADSNSASSGAAWSNNMSGVAHGDMDRSLIDGSDPRAMGGVVISAGIIYDTNDDGDFTDCAAGGVDEDYNVLLYIGHCAWDDVGGSKAALGGLTPKLTLKGIQVDGSLGSATLTDMRPGENYFVVIGLTGLFAPFKGGTLVPNPDFIFPPIPTGAGTSVLPFVWPSAIPPCFPLYYQAWITGPGITGQFSATNGVVSETP